MSNANIHGFGDNNDNDNNKETNGGNNYYFTSREQDSTPIYEKFNYKGDPRNQSIISYLKEAVCPMFYFRSFSFIIIVINIVVYIASFFPYGFETTELGVSFLPPNYRTLDLFGDLSGRKIRQKPYESYRFITNNFLHASFEHIFANCFSILIIGTMFEYLIGTWRYIVIYFISGILGSLFSVLCSPDDSSVGASISVCGLISGLFAFFIINWNALPEIFGTNNKCMIIMFPLMMLFLSLPLVFSTTSGSGIDYSSRINFYGHLGGIIFGFFASFIFVKPKGESDSACLPYKYWFYIGIIVCCLFTIAGFLCFYLLDNFK